MFFRMKILICCKPAVIDKFNLLANIWTHLADVNEQAQERLDLIMEQMKAAEGVTEELKAQNQLAWVQHMNSIRSRAEEIIYAELVYA